MNSRIQIIDTLGRIIIATLGGSITRGNNAFVKFGGMSDPSVPAVSEDQVKLALRRVKDPELNLNIMDLGLVYEILVEGAKVRIDMTLTSPGCPSGPEIMSEAEREVRNLPGVEDVEMNLVWTPFWTPEKMEPRVRAYLGF